MWFKNLHVFRLPKNWDCAPDELAEKLSLHTLQPCAASEQQSLGWVPPAGDDRLLYTSNRQWLIALGAEQKLLPASVVRQCAAERAQAIEEAQGRRVGKRELRELREAVAAELLPRAFLRKRTTWAWIDPVDGWLVVDAASPAKVDEVIKYLHQSFEGLPVRNLDTAQSPSAAMTDWIAAGEAPSGFTIDQDLEMRSAENAVVRYAKHPLEGEEIREHVAMGKVVTKLAMTWNDRISFLLDDKLRIKRLEFLDILKEANDNQAENEAERFELDFTLMTGELARLLADLTPALGGERQA